MNRKTAVIALIILLVLAFLCSIIGQALKPSFEAIHYLETQGYSSVRILRLTAEGHGCQPSDTYHFVFDAISPQGERSEGIACKDANGIWYEE